MTALDPHHKPISYLRVVVTTRCPMQCTYCHMEGDPQKPGGASELPAHELQVLMRIGTDQGINKVKFLGGEPLVRADLPEILDRVHQHAPHVDYSVITSGVTSHRMYDRMLEVGLSRTNVSIHGYGLEAFMRRGGKMTTFAARNAFLKRVLADGRPIKLNYVFTDEQDRDDLAQLLSDAAGWPAVVNVLDDLSDPNASPEKIHDALIALRGEPAERVTVPDPDSLPTTHLIWADGLRVELKDQHLGNVAPYKACAACPKRPQCREGIVALRLMHDGRLQPCMDRPDLAIDIVHTLRTQGEAAASAAWAEFVASV